MKAFPEGTRASDIGAKVGDKFQIATNTESWQGKPGDIVVLETDDGTMNPYFTNLTQGGKRICMHWDFLSQMPEKTFDNLEVGDLIESSFGAKRVLAVCGDIVALSSFNEYEELDDWWTKKEMEDGGFTLKGAEAEPQEMTVEEISKELGREIKVVKSK